MPVVTKWYDESKHILIQEYIGKWTMEEFFKAFDESKGFFLSTPERIDVMLDQKQASHVLPPNVMLHVQNIVNLSTSEFKNWGLGIFVSEWRLHHVLYNVGSKVSVAYQEHVRICRTTEEAVAIIEKDRQESVVKA